MGSKRDRLGKQDIAFVRRMKEHDFTGPEIAKIMGISNWKVYQIINAGKGKSQCRRIGTKGS